MHGRWKKVTGIGKSAPSKPKSGSETRPTRPSPPARPPLPKSTSVESSVTASATSSSTKPKPQRPPPPRPQMTKTKSLGSEAGMNCFRQCCKNQFENITIIRIVIIIYFGEGV